MSTPKITESTANATHKPNTKRRKKVMNSGLFRPPYACLGHESVSFNEAVLSARGELSGTSAGALAEPY